MNENRSKKEKCEFCTYEWISRVKEPKSCPRCKRRFDYKDLREVFARLKKEILGINSNKQFFELEA